MPRAAMPLPTRTMNGLFCPAPAPWPRINAARGAAASYVVNIPQPPNRRAAASAAPLLNLNAGAGQRTGGEAASRRARFLPLQFVEEGNGLTQSGESHTDPGWRILIGRCLIARRPSARAPRPCADNELAPTNPGARRLITGETYASINPLSSRHRHKCDPPQCRCRRGRRGIDAGFQESRNRAVGAARHHGESRAPRVRPRRPPERHGRSGRGDDDRDAAARPVPTRSRW